MSGIGTIKVPGGQSSFSLNVQNRSGKPSGSFAYADTPAHISLSNIMLKTLTITGNKAHLTGMATDGRNRPVTFTVDATDNGDPGVRDTFAIKLSNGYMASGNLTSGNLHIP